MAEKAETSKTGVLLWLVTGAILVGAGVGVFMWLSSGGAAPENARGEVTGPLVRTATVSEADSIDITQSGFVRERFAIDIAAEVGGRIETVDEQFRVGSLVTAGTPLVTLRQDRFEADRMQAQASVEQARAAVDQATAAFDRQQELAASDFASEARLEEARTAREQAEAQLALAQANLVSAEIALEDSVVEAPYDAKIVARSASPGQIVQPGTPFGRLFSAEAVEVSIGLTPSDLRLLGNLDEVMGREVTLHSADDPGLELATGTITAVDPSIAAGTRTTDILIEVPQPFDRPGRSLLLNDLVVVSIPVDLPENALVAPSLAVKAGDRIWQVTPDATLVSHDIAVLRRLGDRTAFSAEGLRAMDRVLLTDLPAPVSGQKVRVRNDAPQSAQVSR